MVVVSVILFVLVSVVFLEVKEKVCVIGIWIVIVSIGMMMGLILGGLLVD